MTKTYSRICPACRQPVKVTLKIIEDHPGKNGMIICRDSGSLYANAAKREEQRIATERIAKARYESFKEPITKPLPFVITQKPGPNRTKAMSAEEILWQKAEDGAYAGWKEAKDDELSYLAMRGALV